MLHKLNARNSLTVQNRARPPPSDADVKKAFKAACLLWHPDKHSGKADRERAAAEAKFKEVRNVSSRFPKAPNRGRGPAC